MLRVSIALSMLLVAALPVTAGEPADAVRFFYQDPSVLSESENRNRFVGPALDFLNAADAAWDMDETVCISFGFAVDGQDYDDSEISGTLSLDESVSDDTASVTAHFTNFGRETQVEWLLQKFDGNWLVSDIASEANGRRVSTMSCE